MTSLYQVDKALVSALVDWALLGSFIRGVVIAGVRVLNLSGLDASFL